MEPAVQRRAKRLPPPERRDQVLDAARELILRFGYAGASMNAVARAAKVTRPVVYDFFANREELLQALLEREEQRALDVVVAAAPDLSRAAEVDDLVVEAMENFLHAVQQEPQLWRLVLLPAQGSPELVREHIESGRQQVLAQLTMVAALVLNARGGPADLDLELLAEFVYQLCEVSIRLMLNDPEQYPAERIVALVRQSVSVLGSPA